MLQTGLVNISKPGHIVARAMHTLMVLDSNIMHTVRQDVEPQDILLEMDKAIQGGTR